MDALAIVNSNQPGDAFQSKNLAGCGVIFYIMLAFRRYLRDKNYFVSGNNNKSTEPNRAEFLDLVALGTVADVVKLDKNNRILVAQGLKCIRARHLRPGIKALLDIIEQRIVGNKHLKLILGLEGKQINAIAFNVDLNQWPNHRLSTIHIVYRLDVKEFNDRRSIQLIIQHIN